MITQLISQAQANKGCLLRQCAKIWFMTRLDLLHSRLVKLLNTIPFMFQEIINHKVTAHPIWSRRNRIKATEVYVIISYFTY